MRRALAITASIMIMACQSLAVAEQSADSPADALFQQGVERFREGDFAAALESFRGSYQASPTPALRYNIGVCHFNLGQWAEARTELTAYLADTDPALITDERREQVEGLLAEIEGQIGPSPAEPVQEPPPPQTSEPPVAQPEPNVPPETPEAHEEPAPTPVEPEDRRRISPAWFWATAGLAVALAVGGGVTGGLVLRQESEFDALVDDCTSGARQGCYDDGVEIRDRADALVTATNVLFATAGAAALAAVVLAIFTEWRGSEGGSDLAMRLSPTVGSSASGFRLDLSLRF